MAAAFAGGMLDAPLRWMATCALSTAAALTLACASDDTPPPAPLLDPVRSPTSLASQRIAGTAEFGARVVVEGAAEPAEGAADPFVARFFIDVALVANADNALSVFAIDEAGNRSEPATATIVQGAAQADGVTVTLDPALISADDGQTIATARIEVDESEISPAGFAVDFELAGVASAMQTATTDESGVASVTFADLTTAGTGTVTAQAAVGAAPAEGTASYEVLAGKATSLDLSVPATVEAGETISAQSEARDAFGNVIAAAAILLETNAPGASISGKEIIIPTAGSWKIGATVAGSGVGDVATVLVTHQSAPESISVLVASPAEAGSVLDVVVLDSFGNTIADKSLTTLSSDADSGASTIDDDADTIAIEEAGSYTLTAEIDGVSADAELEIVPAAAMTLTAVATPSPLTINPSSPTNPNLNSVTVSHVIEDAFGNAVTGPVLVSINMPVAFVEGTTVRNVTTAGAFTIVSQLGDLVDVTPLTVLPPGAGGASAIDLELSAAVIEAGTPVTATFVAQDPFGNAVSPQPNATLASAPAMTGLPTTSSSPLSVSFDRTGNFALTASLASGPSDVELVEVFDSTAPIFDDAASTLSGSVQGAITDLGMIKDGQLLTLLVSGIEDLVGVTEVTLVVLGAAESSQSRFFSPATKGPSNVSFSFTVPDMLPAGSAITIAARVHDASGNLIVVDRSGTTIP